MKNNFSEKTRQLFDMGGYMESWESGKNWANCLHHIMGRVSNSPYNACPLNNQWEHLPEGRHKSKLPTLSDFNVRRGYLLKTKNYLDSIGYKPNGEDLMFLDKFKKYYEESSEESGFLF